MDTYKVKKAFGLYVEDVPYVVDADEAIRIVEQGRVFTSEFRDMERYGLYDRHKSDQWKSKFRDGSYVVVSSRKPFIAAIDSSHNLFLQSALEFALQRGVHKPTFSTASCPLEDSSDYYTENKYAQVQAQALARMTSTDPEPVDWQPVAGNYPRLIYKTQNNLNDDTAPDIVSGNEDRETIESYGFMSPFKNKYGYTLADDEFVPEQVLIEDQFNLPAEEHFKRMRSLANEAVLNFGFSIKGKTKDIFFEMVDKFERNEGGTYSHSDLTEALQNHETTTEFHAALQQCLSDNLKEGSLPVDIVSISSQYMKSSKGTPLPQFRTFSANLFDGTVLTVHGIWAMEVYAERLEYKGDQIRGTFRYEIQDHFGLNPKDINHKIPSYDNLPFEKLEGFRSWYLLQHYNGYGYKPFTTVFEFEL